LYQAGGIYYDQITEKRAIRCSDCNHRMLQFKHYIAPAGYAEVVNSLTKLD